MDTLVIGLDAATWRHIDPMLDAGELPALRSLLEGGVRGTLKSTMPPMTPLAWTSMMTGVNPGKHGIYDFFELDHETYELSTTEFDEMERAAVWDIFSFENVSAGFFNIPVVFPPPQCSEFFVSGIPSEREQDIAHPRSLLSRLRESDFRVQPSETPQEGLEEYFEAVVAHTETQADLVEDLIREHDLDHFWTVFMGLDWVQHYLWNTTIGGENAVRRLYRHVDDIIRRLLELVGDDVTILVVSDHGAREIEGEIHLNSFLKERGFTAVSGGEGSLRRSLSSKALATGWALGKSLPEELRSLIKTILPASTMGQIERNVGVGHKAVVDDIDWEATTGFAYGYMGRVFVHRADRYPDGTVESDQYEEVRNRLKAAFESATNPRNGDPIFEAVLRPEDVYEGDRLSDAADLLVVPTDWKYMMYGDFGDSWLHEPRKRVADHEPEGVLIANGPGIETAESDADIVDIAPTLLALHDLPVLNSMDGNVIGDIVPTVGTVNSVDEGVYLSKTSSTGRSDAQKEAARERLEDLGYL